MFHLKYLKELRANPMRAKIIIADVHDDILMKTIMCAASKLTVSEKQNKNNSGMCSAKCFF